ncbi:hypothetical protein [Fusobacterium mortiferum]|uniref:Uncharacterized protein n=1 Tax=Fusobacterium mortiferum TaxID=850 RepID=A0ABS2G0N8_FUSMR|nr:hypothetical protein [Fusobacterium mortiferum]MBM6874427.1 hypothetical protein [Fusobacterium mortiferum]
MEFNVDNLEQYRNNILKRKKVYKFDDNISIYFLGGEWIFAIRNRIRVRNKDWEEFKLSVAAVDLGGKR